AALGRDTLAPPELLRARAVYLPEGTTFVPAYELELRVNDAVEGQLAVHLIASGIDGEVLRERSLLHEAHSYRVWADTNGDQAPWSGPEETVMPHPTGRVDGFVPLPLPSRLLSVTGRNHGPLGEPDPWLPAG